LWLFIFALSLAVLFMSSFYALFRGMGGAPPSLSRDTTITVDLARSFTEDPVYALGPFVDTQDLTFRDLLLAIKAAKDDARVERLFLHVRGTSLGWANLFELRSQLVDFKDNGKPVVAFIEYAGNRDYVLASAADEVYLHPRASIDFRGVRAELMFVKGSLDKLGVTAEFERIGAYKDGPDMFLRESMSAESREAIAALISTIHDAIVEAIATGRGLAPDEVETLIAEGPFIAAEAKQRGLVDDLKYIDEVRTGFSANDADPNLVAIGDYRLSVGSGFSTKGRIAIVYGVGAIVGGGSGDDAVFGRVMGSDTIARAFESAREDDSIDAVVFRIDSPGGSDVASDVIWRAAKLTQEKKPVVVSMANVAASGGYWIAMASDTIVAEPTTITGSIGIYGGKFNLSGLYEKLGVSRDGVSSAPNADYYSDNRNFTEEERAKFRKMIETGYQAFLERVAESRGKTVDEIHKVAQGRVWSGAMALEHGLVDELGGLDHAISLAKEKAGFQSTDRFELVIYPEKKSVFQALLANFLQSRSAPSLELEMLHPDELLERSPLLESLAHGQPHALMPYTLELR
jgi:protease-4